MESHPLEVSPSNMFVVFASFKISVISVTLFTSAVIAVTLFDSNGKRIDRTLIKLTGDDYSLWQGDDNYLVTYVNNYISNVYLPGLGGVN